MQLCQTLKCKLNNDDSSNLLEPGLKTFYDFYDSAIDWIEKHPEEDTEDVRDEIETAFVEIEMVKIEKNNQDELSSDQQPCGSKNNSFDNWMAIFQLLEDNFGFSESITVSDWISFLF